MYTRYAVISRKTRDIKGFFKRRAGWDGANTKAQQLAMGGDPCWIMRVVASTEVHIVENKKRT